MNEAALFGALIVAVYAMGAFSFLWLLLVPAPYGRHARKGWGPTIANRAGWIVMESPTVIVFAAVYASGPLRAEPAPVVLLAAWMFHYVYRAFIYPFRIRSTTKRMPLTIVGMGFAFNVLNAYLNARWISKFGSYGGGAGVDGWMWAGLALFLGGWLLNQSADHRLIRMRRTDDSTYRIPRGWPFRFVTCPNYLGEIIEWSGWALASRSPAALAFAVFTFANLAPRARTHHRWYHDRLPDYPSERKALIPFVF